MLSAPPAMMISAPPERMRSAAMAMACRPELQKRLMVTPVTVSGRPARRATQRAMLLPDSASGMAQPRTMSSISAAGTCGCFSKRRRMTAPARSSGREVRSAPRGALPTAVRRQSIMTASCMDPLRPLADARGSVSQRLSGLQHVLHAFLRLALAAQAEEGLPLQIQQVLFGDGLTAGQGSAAQYVCQFLSYHGIVIRDVIGLPRQIDAGLEQREIFGATHFHIGARHAGGVAGRDGQGQSLGIVDEALGVHGDLVLRAQQAEIAGFRGAGRDLGVGDQFEGFLRAAEAQQYFLGAARAGDHADADFDDAYVGLRGCLH